MPGQWESRMSLRHMTTREKAAPPQSLLTAGVTHVMRWLALLRLVGAHFHRYADQGGVADPPANHLAAADGISLGACRRI